MKKFLFFVLVISALYLAAQQTDEISTIPINSNDSTEVLIDSLQVNSVTDSLDFTILQDSLFSAQFDSLGYVVVDGDTLYPKTEDMIDDAQEDSIFIDLEQLATDLQKRIEEKRNCEFNLMLPFVFSQENFHIASPFEPNLYIRKNGFTEIPFLVSKTHYFQNYEPLFVTSYKQGFLEFNSSDYDLPVSISEAYLGLGDIEMNHAAIFFQKGKLFGIDNLNVEVDYLGQDGSWLGKREKSRNFDLHLWHRNFWGSFHFYYTDIDQTISSNALSNAPELGELANCKEKNVDMNFKWENKFLTAGVRQQNVEIDSLEMELKSILLAKQIEIGTHYLSGSYEYFNFADADNYGLFSFSNNSRISSLDFSNNVLYRKEDNFYLNSLLKWNFYYKFSALANYEKYGDENKSPLWQEERKAAGIEFKNSNIDIKIFTGQENLLETENLFLESIANLNLPINNFTVLLKNWNLYRNTEEKEIPLLQIKTDLEFDYNLKYNNKIKLGISHIYVSEYGYIQDSSEGLILNDFMNLNAWLGIQITDKFQIQLDAVNILNADELFGYPTSYNLKDMHFNFNIYWLFVN